MIRYQIKKKIIIIKYHFSFNKALCSCIKSKTDLYFETNQKKLNKIVLILQYFFIILIKKN